jgi:hypothetical protein
MKLMVVLSTAIVLIIGLNIPGIAQINRPSQDFFEQGREQLEREIQILREESPNAQENTQKKPEPVLQVSPSPDQEPQPQPSPSATPKPRPT